jgi:hypothetical protein
MHGHQVQELSPGTTTMLPPSRSFVGLTLTKSSFGGGRLKGHWRVVVSDDDGTDASTTAPSPRKGASPRGNKVELEYSRIDLLHWHSPTHSHRSHSLTHPLTPLLLTRSPIHTIHNMSFATGHQTAYIVHRTLQTIRHT